MAQEIRTEFYIEVPYQGRTVPIPDEFRAIEMVKTQYPNGRVVRRIVRTEILEDVVYPIGISTWNPKFGDYSI